MKYLAALMISILFMSLSSSNAYASVSDAFQQREQAREALNRAEVAYAKDKSEENLAALNAAKEAFAAAQENFKTTLSQQRTIVRGAQQTKESGRDLLQNARQNYRHNRTAQNEATVDNGKRLLEKLRANFRQDAQGLRRHGKGTSTETESP